MDKLAYREFHSAIAEKKSTRGRKRVNECFIISRYKALLNGKINQQRLAIKYLLNLHLEKWILLRRVAFFNEILSENSEFFRSGTSSISLEGIGLINTKSINLI